MQKTVFYITVLLSAIGCFVSKKAVAADLPPIITLVNPLKGSSNQLVKGASNYIDAAENVVLSNTVQPFHRITNIVSFYLNEDTTMFLQSNFIAKVRYRLYFKNAAGVLDSLTNQWLDISYRGVTGDSTYDQRKSFYFYNAYYTRILIDSFYTNVSWNVRPALILMNEMRISLDYQFNCATASVTGLNYNTNPGYTQADELYVSWNKTEGADEYDLEWSYIDSLSLNNYKTGGAYDPQLIFENNATRVSVSDSSAYRIPLLYDDGGILFYRVRPVQNKLNGSRIEGTWSASTGSNWFYTYEGHQKALNWQASTSFAEEGKRKSVVQYFDGTLRNRQTVTKDNTTSLTVVAETFYDHQGRPQIQVLPAPTLSKIIAYTQNFNRMNTGEYDKSRYDTIINPSAYCNTGGDTMSVLSGASRYYSPNNPEKNTGFNKFIPDAKGYPYTETQYTQDNTGRISKQSGVGPDHRMGSGHETKYFYGTASQRELDALFGTEVGNYSHYFKNMVRDANGQYSVSYVDMKGRTIATALAGKLSDSIYLDTLAAHNTAIITERLIDSASNITKGLTMEASKGLVVTKSGTHRFQYSLNPEVANIFSCSSTSALCLNCFYDLEITISGDCNNQQFGGQVVRIRRSNITLNPGTNCSPAPPTYPNVDTSIFLSEGTYLVTKKLTVSKSALDYYRDSVFLVNNTCKTKQQFIQEQLSEMRSQSDCEVSCETCLANVSNWQTYRHNYMVESGYPFSDTAMYRHEALAAYNEEIENCEEICKVTGQHKDIRTSMLADMTFPSGQYADTNNIDAVSIFNIYPNSNYLRYKNPNIVYYDEDGKPDSVLNKDGNLVIPQELDIDEFVANFKASWAESLLPMHPEYCFLESYENYEASHDWDKRFLAVETFRQAKDSGFINPLGLAEYPQYNSGNKDPLFHPTNSPRIVDHISNTSRSARFFMRDSILYYRTNPNGGFVRMWNMAAITAHCKANDAACAQMMTTQAHPLDTTLLCEGEADMAWRSFREMYMREKEEVLHKLVRTSCLGLYEELHVNQINVMRNHTFRFPDPTFLDHNYHYANAADTTAAKKQIKDSLHGSYVDNCKAYAEQWLLQLTQCPLYDTANIRVEALPHLINVCVKGSDVWHPYGSSSISPDSSYTFNSFQDVMNWYNNNHGITDQVQCNAYIIKNPPPYGQQGSPAIKPIWSKPDSCDCAKITELYNHYTANQSQYTSFSDYILKKHGTTISNAALDSLCNLCNGVITCNYLLSPILLPPVLQCGVKDLCINCIAIDTLYQRFQTLYPGIVPRYDDATDTLQQKKNRLFANFMNNKLGFSYTHVNYLQFIERCMYTGAGNPVTFDTTAVTCKELDNFIANYYYTYLKPATGYVDYDMRTFAGNLTPDEGPKGVFDVNNNLIGNTVSGTVTQIKNSYVSIWNSSPVNNAIGTLSLLANGKFRLTLNPGATAPCNGIIGMRYYQFDFASDTLNAIRLGDGCYVDFGDGVKTKVPMIPNYSPAPNTFIPFARYNRVRWSVPDRKNFYSAYLQHFYPNTLSKTITVYHSELNGLVGFDNHTISSPFKLRYLSNLRGYIPQQTYGFGFHSTQDSTISRTSQLYNFNQINTIEYFDIANGSNDNIATGFDYNRIAPLTNNHNMQEIWFFHGHIDNPAVSPKKFHKLFPNLPINFPNVGQLYITDFANELDEDSVNFALPKLKSFSIGTNNITNSQIDNILIQIANAVTKDSGEVVLHIYTNANRTAASDGAVSTLLAKKWRLLIAGTYYGWNWSPPAAQEPAVKPDSIPYTNPFTEYFNQSFNTNLSFHQIEQFYQRKCGKPLNYCSLPTLKDTLICGKSEPWIVSVDTIPAPCADSTELAIIKGSVLYEAYVDSLKNNFEDLYLSKCLNAYKHETFTVTRPVSEFHYTLYYYDQAGNLVKTVPPAGVRPVYRQTWLDSVANFRKNGAAQRLVPAHTLATTYRYNTLNQVVAQKTPDAGTSNFWYDRLGRLVISQNAKQSAQSTKLYSYTQYDALGRITEVGQKPQVTLMTNTISRSQPQLQSWLDNVNYPKQQITRTVYDTAVVNAGVTANIRQRNLRNRVSYTTFTNVEHMPGSTQQDPGWNNAVFYSYDIHGNVDTLLNDYGSSLHAQTQNPMNLRGNRWKKLVYQYDLISGKVNHIAYQPGMRDALYHRYVYDAENRLIAAETSTDSLYWERDARYSYYRHGPMAKTILGHQRIQGLDYAYTLQGWLKGVNGTVMNPAHDMGLDGNNTTTVARDTFGFSLYYHGNDYTAINDVNRFAGLRARLVTANAHRPLFNGNISAMAVNIGALNKPVLYNYTYDQLNRLVAMDVFNGSNTGVNLWSGTFTAVTDYQERISYDANGNILRYKRNGAAGKPGMDSMTYKYMAGSNKLGYVRDSVPAGNYVNTLAAPYNILDIDNQLPANANVESTFNYQYDEIGNLVRDSVEGIRASVGGIKWNVYGKITEINKVDSSASVRNVGRIRRISYYYDAAGNRIGSKTEKYGTSATAWTWYVRDASGNVMTVYSYTDSLRVSEQYLYGSSRLGSINPGINLDRAVAAGTNIPLLGGRGNIATFTRGNKFFELSNHLGNVLVTLSDKKRGVQSGTSGSVLYYLPMVKTAQDYYPFGMQMPGRKYTAPGSNYRYGFNGKEEDDEVKGEGNQQDYGMRIYDTRLGRFLSNDPLSKTFPYYSPYHFAGCNPIRNVDLDGGEPKDFMVNWIAMTMTDAKTGVEVGSAIDMFGRNYRAIYDKVTQKAWFIHEGNNGQYEYWQHNPGANELQYRISNTGKTDNGSWQPFETRDASYAKQFQKSHDRLTAGLITIIAAAPAIILGGISGIVAAEGTAVNVATQILYRYWLYAPQVGIIGRTAAEFLDESGSLGGASSGSGFFRSGTLQKIETSTSKWVYGKLGFIGEKSGSERVLETGGVLSEKGKELTIDAVGYVMGISNDEAKGELSRTGLNALVEQYKNFAKEGGFTKLILNYTRSEGSSSKNPGSTMQFIFDLTQ